VTPRTILQVTSFDIWFIFNIKDNNRMLKMTFHNNKGFTLIELMITVALIGILAAIALPAYQDYVTRARRADAKNIILSVQLAQEKWRANNSSYTDSMTNLGYPGDSDQTSPDGYYKATVTNTSGTTYTITAVPQGSQAANDTECASFIINQDGTQSVTGTASANPSVCWAK